MPNFSVEQSLMKAKSYANKGEIIEAEKLYETILKKFSNNLRAQQGLAALKKHNVNKNIQNPPQEVINQLVNLYNQGQFAVVVDQGEALIKQYPTAILIWNILGASYIALGFFVKATEALQKVTELNPNYDIGFNNLGIALKNQGRLDEAVETFQKALLINPLSYEAFNNMGNALQNNGKLDDAIKAYNEALFIKPNHAHSHNNMGGALEHKGKIEEAIVSYKKSISLNPTYADAHQNLGYLYLNRGKLKEGLDEIEWRWKTDIFSGQKRNFLQPLWDGKQSLNGKRILIWHEQGVGDTINWSSILPLATNRAAHCILECQEKLVPLLKRSFPNVEVKPEDRSRDLKRDDFDYHLPMGSLYKHFLQEITDNPKPDAHLIPDPDRVNHWRGRLNLVGKGPYIGIAWKSSNMSVERLPNYSCISEWSQILSLPDVTFINLQSKDFADDLAKVREELGITIHNFDDLDQWNNIDDVAALCSAIDMVICNHGTVPLISGGVGTVTKLANWRQSSWNNILHNPVGPSIDIFERDTLEPWENVFNSIAEDIVELKKNGEING